MLYRSPQEAGRQYSSQITEPIIIAVTVHVKHTLLSIIASIEMIGNQKKDKRRKLMSN